MVWWEMPVLSAVESSHDSRPHSADSERSAKILVVAPPSTTRDLAVVALLVDGYSVRAADGPEVAGAIIERIMPDLVIVMPGTDGSLDGWRYPVPTLVVGLDAAESPPQPSRAQYFHYLEGPFSRRGLVTAVREIIERHERHKEPRLSDPGPGRSGQPLVIAPAGG